MLCPTSFSAREVELRHPRGIERQREISHRVKKFVYLSWSVSVEEGACKESGFDSKGCERRDSSFSNSHQLPRPPACPPPSSPRQPFFRESHRWNVLRRQSVHEPLKGIACEILAGGIPLGGGLSCRTELQIRLKRGATPAQTLSSASPQDGVACFFFKAKEKSDAFPLRLIRILSSGQKFQRGGGDVVWIGRAFWN